MIYRFIESNLESAKKFWKNFWFLHLFMMGDLSLKTLILKTQLTSEKLLKKFNKKNSTKIQNIYLLPRPWERRSIVHHWQRLFWDSWMVQVCHRRYGVCFDTTPKHYWGPLLINNFASKSKDGLFSVCDARKCVSFVLLTLTKKCWEKNWSWVWVNGDCRHNHQSHHVASEPIDGCAPKESV